MAGYNYAVIMKECHWYLFRPLHFRMPQTRATELASPREPLSSGRLRIPEMVTCSAIVKGSERLVWRAGGVELLSFRMNRSTSLLHVNDTQLASCRWLDGEVSTSNYQHRHRSPCLYEYRRPSKILFPLTSRPRHQEPVLDKKDLPPAAASRFESNKPGPNMITDIPGLRIYLESQAAQNSTPPYEHHCLKVARN